MWHSPPSGIGTLGCDVDCTTAKKLYWPVLHMRKNSNVFQYKCHKWSRTRYICIGVAKDTVLGPILLEQKNSVQLYKCPEQLSYTNLTYIYHNYTLVKSISLLLSEDWRVVCDCWRVPAPWGYWSRQSIIAVLFWYRMVEMDVYIDPRLVWGREYKEVKVQPLSYQVRYQERCKENIWNDKSLVFSIFRYNWTEAAAFKQNELAI